MNFIPYIQEVWTNCSQDMALGGSQRLVAKLKRTKMARKVWNKQVFGWVDHIISELLERVDVLEGASQEEYTSKVEQDFLASKIELAEWRKREELRLSQIAKKKWIKEGNNNTKFFHAVIAQHQKNRKLDHMVLENGVRLPSPQHIHQKAVKYFE